MAGILETDRLQRLLLDRIGDDCRRAAVANQHDGVANRADNAGRVGGVDPTRYGSDRWRSREAWQSLGKDFVRLLGRGHRRRNMATEHTSPADEGRLVPNEDERRNCSGLADGPCFDSNVDAYAGGLAESERQGSPRGVSCHRYSMTASERRSSR